MIISQVAASTPEMRLIRQPMKRRLLIGGQIDKLFLVCVCSKLDLLLGIVFIATLALIEITRRSSNSVQVKPSAKVLDQEEKT